MGSYFVLLEMYLRFMGGSVPVRFRLRYAVAPGAVAIVRTATAKVAARAGKRASHGRGAGPSQRGFSCFGGQGPRCAEIVFYSASPCLLRFVPSVRILPRGGASSAAPSDRAVWSGSAPALFGAISVT